MRSGAVASGLAVSAGAESSRAPNVGVAHGLELGDVLPGDDGTLIDVPRPRPPLDADMERARGRPRPRPPDGEDSGELRPLLLLPPLPMAVVSGATASTWDTAVSRR